MWNWIKKKIKWLLFGSVALAATIAVIPADQCSSTPGYFAELDKNNTVVRVIKIDECTLKSGHWGNPNNWKETSKHGEVRKNGAAKGYVYDAGRDAFIAPKRHPDMILDEQTARWKFPNGYVLPESLTVPSRL